MTAPMHKWTSLDIAQHVRNLDGDLAPLADLRSGNLYLGDTEPPMTGLRIVLFVVAGITAFALGYMTAPDMAVRMTEAGYETCMREGC